MSADDRRLNLPKRAAPQHGASLALPEREEKILEFWERNKIFEKTLQKTQKGRRFIFYEGPPTANAAPGIHHVAARAFKDVIPRYQTMRGRYVERKAGWDTHGLPVEIQVEKALGLKSKKDIERYGIARFNAKCRASVWRFKEEWEQLTQRIGFWLDLGRPYITYEPSYMETLWWIIKEFWKKKLLYQDFKVVPWCPRCETALSTHELGQGYETVKDRSLYVRFRVKSQDPRWRKTAILSWTTTPWTLPGNAALAVNPRESYVTIPDPEVKGQWLILGERRFRDLVEKHFFPPEYRRSIVLDDIDTFTGKELVGLAYEPPFAVKELRSQKSHRVYPADFVTMEEGTGVVHTAVMYGEDDYRLGAKVGLPKFHTVTETGHFIKGLGEGLGGLPVKDPKTQEKVIASLQSRGLLFKEELYEHDYPFCWRCETPLLYYARQAWWVKVSALKRELLANNEKINWIPEYLKHGRFGEFLREVRDWAFSRERYWGTPLPVWKCGGCKDVEVVGSLAELDARDPAPTTLILMRHGQTHHNVKDLMNPLPAHDREPLTERGGQDALAAAKRLKREGIYAIVASPSRRAQETARIAARELGVKKIETLSALNDIYVGGFAGRPVSDFAASFASLGERFTKKPRGAENLRELRVRVMKAAAAIREKHAGERVLVVSHGDPSWVMMAALEGLPEADYARAHYLKPAEFRKVRLHNWPYGLDGQLDLHRPFVDGILLKCPKCRGAMRRVPEVCDVWFDSGAMPFAQAHYPFARAQSQKLKAKSQKLLYPADYIAEAVDQTRGWFYTLLAVSTLLGRGPSYRNVISLGHVLDREGQKMSKSRGNVVDPWAMIKKYGSDAVRWYFYTANAPGDPKRFDEKDLLLKLRGPIATLWNSLVFFDTYVDQLPAISHRLPARHVLDRWVLAKLEMLTREVMERLERYDIVGAARALEQFIVEDFSNWYLRRSRRRFQHPRNLREKDEAAATTAGVLLRFAELMAPFTPFLAEIIYRGLRPKLGLREESAHLRPWPSVKLKAKNQKLEALLEGMAEVRRIAASALALRAKAGIKVRQPLAELKAKSQKLKAAGLLEVLKDEVNVKGVTVDPRIKDEVELDTALTPQLREEGMVRELIRNIQELRREAGFKPGQGISCQVSGDREVGEAVAQWKRFIQGEAHVKAIQIGGKRSSRVGREMKLDGRKVWIGITEA